MSAGRFAQQVRGNAKGRASEPGILTSAPARSSRRGPRWRPASRAYRRAFACQCANAAHSARTRSEPRAVRSWVSQPVLTHAWCTPNQLTSSARMRRSVPSIARSRQRAACPRCSGREPPGGRLDANADHGGGQCVPIGSLRRRQRLNTMAQLRPTSASVDCTCARQPRYPFCCSSDGHISCAPCASAS